MPTVVFVGPTLRLEQARQIATGEIDWRPPARRGDIFHAVNNGARRVGLIDGYFRSYPSVSHKEILWSLNQGCHILGAASMGALRATELGMFGMLGVGRIFEDFAHGRLSRDDEVAVEHAPGELNYLPTSEALVNIRYTVAHALAEGKASETFCRAFLMAACEMHYSARTWGAVLKHMERGRRLTEPDIRSFDWLVQNRINQKALDAMEMLHVLSDSRPNPKNFHFEDTYFFARLRAFESNPLIRHLS
jgi:hypothetical protein